MLISLLKKGFTWGFQHKNDDMSITEIRQKLDVMDNRIEALNKEALILVKQNMLSYAISRLTLSEQLQKEAKLLQKEYNLEDKTVWLYF